MKIHWKLRYTHSLFIIASLLVIGLTGWGYFHYRFPVDVSPNERDRLDSIVLQGVLVLFSLPAILPATILLAMPGRRSLFISAMLLIVLCAWGFRDNAHDHGGPVNLGAGIPYLVLISTLTGFAVRAGILIRKSRVRLASLRKINWKSWDIRGLCILIALFVLWKALDANGVCLEKMRPITDKEAVALLILGPRGWDMTEDERQKVADGKWGAYQPGCCAVGFRGHSHDWGWLMPYSTYSIDVQVVQMMDVGRYLESYYELDACGRSPYDPQRMGISEKEYLEDVARNKEIWLKKH